MLSFSSVQFSRLHTAKQGARKLQHLSASPILFDQRIDMAGRNTDDDDQSLWETDRTSRVKLVNGLNFDQLTKGVEFTVEDLGYDDPYLENQPEESERPSRDFRDWPSYREKESIQNLPFAEMAKRMTVIHDDGWLKKKVITPGAGKQPSEGDVVIIHYQLFLEGAEEPYDSSRVRNRRFRFTVGNGVLPCIELAVMSMKKSERSSFLASHQLAYGELGAAPRIPPKTDIFADIELLEIVDASDAATAGDASDVNFAAGLRQCKELHMAANECFKRSDTNGAIRKYKKALNNIEELHLANEEEEVEMLKLRLKIHVNLAIVFDKTNEPGKACIHCREALAIDQRSVKAHFQYGRANLKLNNFDIARKHLKMGLSLTANKKEFEQELVRLEEKIKQCNERENRFCKKFMGVSVDE